MPHLLVPMKMAVHSRGHRIMKMGVVPVIVSVRVFVLRLVVFVFVPVTL